MNREHRIEIGRPRLDQREGEWERDAGSGTMAGGDQTSPKFIVFDALGIIGHGDSTGRERR